jgi:hypothetical protein
VAQRILPLEQRTRQSRRQRRLSRGFRNIASTCRNRREPNVKAQMRHIVASQPSKEKPMKYLLSIYASEAEEDKMSPEAMGQVMQAYGAYTEALVKAGVLQAGERLRPSTDATSVRVRGGKTEVLNGPYAETREQLGGYYVIDVADLDAALAWAARCPTSSYGTIEVRPIWEM